VLYLSVPLAGTHLHGYSFALSDICTVHFLDVLFVEQEVMSFLVIRTDIISPANAIVGGNEQLEFSQELGDALRAAGRGQSARRLLQWLDTPSAVVIPPDRVAALASEIRGLQSAHDSAMTQPKAGEYAGPEEFQRLLEFIDGAAERSMYVLMNVGVIP
jgi:hypothetical protein